MISNFIVFSTTTKEEMAKLKAELMEKDSQLTDAQLTKLADAHQMEQLKSLIIALTVSFKAPNI